MSSEPKIVLETSRFQVVQVTQETADGGLRKREIIRHPGAVAILPLVDERHVCLIKNFRVALNRTLIELPAGALEVDEDPQLTAERELLEETGYRAERLESLHSFYLSPGILDERMHLFLATGLRAGQPAREPGEIIENLVLPWDEAVHMVCDGRIQDAKTIVGLLYYSFLKKSRTDKHPLCAE